MKDFVLFVRHFFKILSLVGPVLAVLLALIAVGAAIIALAEGINYWDALYFAAITGLTIGYGDITPVTAVGRIVAVLIGLMGVVFFGVIVAVATRALVHSVEERHGIHHNDGS